jgi:hypothetical protein
MREHLECLSRLLDWHCHPRFSTLQPNFIAGLMGSFHTVRTWYSIDRCLLVTQVSLLQTSLVGLAEISLSLGSLAMALVWLQRSTHFTAATEHCSSKMPPLVTAWEN